MSFCFKASTGFVRVPEGKNWTDAQKYCREKHTDLASVRNESDNKQIQTIINQNPSSSKQAWIGLYKFWAWSDNSTASFTHWKSGEPNIGAKQDSICTSTDMSNGGQWIDVYCTDSYPFVCYDGEYINHLSRCTVCVHVQLQELITEVQ